MNYVFRSIATIAALYGLVFLTADLTLSLIHAPALLIVAVPNVIIVLQFLLAPWLIELFLEIEWSDDKRSVIPARNLQFVEATCAKYGLPKPKIGLVRSATPNAFTFGRFQNDARVVVTEGLLDSLEPEEIDAVIAHELGHVKHWDFLVLTFAALAPMLLYTLYRLIRMMRNQDSNAVAWATYAVYWVSQFTVLFLSRTREYFADEFSAEATNNPGALASSLVKIGYGLAQIRNQARFTQGSKSNARVQRDGHVAGIIGVLGISSASDALCLTPNGDPQGPSAIMKWDLVSPWAHIYELSSTHPLTARRVARLNAESEMRAQTVAFPVPSCSAGTNWGGRFVPELLLWAGPALLVASYEALRIARLNLHLKFNPIAFFALALALPVIWAIRVAYRYMGNSPFPVHTIRELLENTEVSNMRPIPTRIEGTIVGRGDASAFWSPDLVIQDKTGMLFMVNRQSIPLARLAAVRKADQFVGRRVVLEGWYRRGLKPYIELSKLSTTDNSKGPALTHRSYTMWIQLGWAALGAMGLILLLLPVVLLRRM